MSASLLSLLVLFAQAAAPSGEPSVRPGVNQQYLDRDLSVWQQRFESAGREIFDQREAILAAAGLKPGMRIADVGAGTGLFTFAFAGAVGPRGRVYAVDIIPGFIDHLKAQARRRRTPQVTPVLGQARSVSLPPGSVDVVFLCDTYHHFEYPRSMNRSMFRALRPGGTLVLIDFVRDPARTSKSTLDHVRAGQQEFTAELVAAGFVPVEEPPPVPALKENYFVRFTRPAN